MLNDKTIIVTGSSSGIGLAIAKACLQAGANVLLHGTREKQLKEAATQLGGKAAWIACNLAEEDAAPRIIQAALDNFGRLDGLVNNAGVFPRNNIHEAGSDLFDDIFHINTRAPMLLCKEAVKIFKQQNSPGSIINIGSINAHCGQTDLLIYSMSKGALMTMTRNLGDALGPDKIRVNQLNVGWTLTETEHKTQMGEGHPEDWLDRIPLTFAPSGTILRPEQIAPHALFWLSDQSVPVSGQVYEVEQYPLIGRSKTAER